MSRLRHRPKVWKTNCEWIVNSKKVCYIVVVRAESSLVTFRKNVYEVESA